MAMNPAMLMTVMNDIKTFEKNHPRFASFFKDVVRCGVPCDSIIEIKVTKPDGSESVANMKVTQSDLDIVNDLKNLGM